MKRSVDVTAVLLVFLTTTLVLVAVYNISGEDDDQQVDESSYKEFKSAAVATSVGPCSTVGKKMLKEGGSVVDAAIAAMLCVSVYNPQSAGIGGGFFMSYYDAATGQGHFINGREVAPLTAHEDMYKGSTPIRIRGPEIVAVPGEIAGYWEAHKRFGKLKWPKLFEPAIKAASQGVALNKGVVDGANQVIRFLGFSDELREMFTTPNGSVKAEGDKIFLTKLAKTLQTIADGGADSFYNGKLAKDIVKDLQDAKGGKSLISEKDLKEYRVDVKPLANISLGDMTVLLPGAPSGGPVLSLILNILKGYNFSSASTQDKDAKTLTYHRLAEAFKFAYGARMKLGDENFNSDVSKIIQTIMSDDYAEALWKKINDKRTKEEEFYMQDFSMPPDDHGTGHLSIIGEDGSAVSMTSSINIAFGSGIMGKRTGILFNNEMADFSQPDSNSPSNNLIEPGKRPLSSMTPTIVLAKDGDKPTVKMAVGGSGGMRIITGIAYVIMNSLWFEEDLEKAVSMKRFHHQLRPNHIEFEPGFDQDMIDRLKGKGHVGTFGRPGMSKVHAVKRLHNNNLGAVTDARRYGYPDGY